VQIEYDPLPPVFTIEESERQDVIVWGADNLLKSFLLEKGDVDSAWASAAHIVEGEYRTGAQEHLYIENNGMIAEYSAEGGVTVWGSLQCPYYVLQSLCARSSICPKTKCASFRLRPAAHSAARKTIPPRSLPRGLLAMKSGHL
jgi:CO/xanthine dehydrogenase Mo-binding subunit